MQPVIGGPCGLTCMELLYLMPRYFSWIHPQPVIHLPGFLRTFSHLFSPKNFSHVFDSSLLSSTFLLKQYPSSESQSCISSFTHSSYITSLPRIMCFLSSLTRLSWRQRQKGRPKRWYICTKLHGVTSQKAALILHRNSFSIFRNERCELTGRCVVSK
jgi:hypothetical protein